MIIVAKAMAHKLLKSNIVLTAPNHIECVACVSHARSHKNNGTPAINKIPRFTQN